MTEDISLRIIRTTIFSIVVPHKEPCSTYKIKMEYKDMEGEDIPFADYGHRNLDEFLLAHPLLNGMQQEGKWVFTAKMSERSANIQALVKGQKGKKKKGKKAPFARNFTRSSYHGKATLGNGDVRRANGAQPFARNVQSYRSFTSGAPRPPMPTPTINSNLSNSKNTVWGSQQWGSSRPGSTGGWSSSSSSSNAPSSSRPSQPWMANQPLKFFPTLAPNRPSNSNNGPQEGMRRFNHILSKCKGAATLRVFCRLYAQEFKVAFVGEELERHFNTVNLTEVINKYGNDRILVSSTPDGSVMFTDSEVLAAHTRAAKEMEEKKKNSVVIEPERKHCTIPSLKVMYDELTEMLVESFPDPIPVGEITSRYERRSQVRVDPIAVFALTWDELVAKKFNSRMRMDNGKAALTPQYIKANNLQVRPNGERKKQELVTLKDLGIVFLEESSQEDDDDDDEDEGEDEESQSEKDSCASSTSKNTKTCWRDAPSLYGSTCSSVASSVQCLNANLSPSQDMNETVSEEVDELAELMSRTVKRTVKVEQDCPRLLVTFPSSINGETTSRRNLMSSFNAKAKDENEKPARPSSSFFSKFVSGLPFKNSSRNNANATVSVPPTVSTPPTVSAPTVSTPPTLSTPPTVSTHPTVTFNPRKELPVDSTGSYNSFSLTLDSDDKYAVQVNCASPYYRLLGSTSFTSPRQVKMMQVIREYGPKGSTPVSVDFVKVQEEDTRSPGDIMKGIKPTFSAEYIFNAI